MSSLDNILTEARSTYLNEPAGNKYTDGVMLPLVRTASGFMQTKLQENGLQIVSEEATKVIGAGDKEWYPLPVDFAVPVMMEERQPDTTDEYTPMTLYYNIPNVTPGSCLGSWAWRVDRLFLGEADTAREAKLYYRRSFPSIKTKDDAQLFGLADQYLAAKSAALAFMFIDQAPTLAETANDVAENELERIINICVKIKQAVPVRRKPYRPFRVR